MPRKFERLLDVGCQRHEASGFIQAQVFDATSKPRLDGFAVSRDLHVQLRRTLTQLVMLGEPRHLGLCLN
jgi:hypothetical protein